MLSEAGVDADVDEDLLDPRIKQIFATDECELKDQVVNFFSPKLSKIVQLDEDFSYSQSVLQFFDYESQDAQSCIQVMDPNI